VARSVDGGRRVRGAGGKVRQEKWRLALPYSVKRQGWRWRLTWLAHAVADEKAAWSETMGGNG
jgi:hypothetical protein